MTGCMILFLHGVMSRMDKLLCDLQTGFSFLPFGQSLQFFPS